MAANRQEKRLTSRQEVRLREYLAKNWKKDPVSAAIVLLAWDAGLSPGEISALRWDAVDLSEGFLVLGERRIPLEGPLEELLGELLGENVYVIPNGRSNYTPMNRVSVSRKARQTLDRAGEPDVTLTDLREDFLRRLMERLPMEQVVEISGYEVRSIQEYARRIGIQPPELSGRGDRQASPPAGALLSALVQEGDTLDSRIVLLSWLGGLTLEQMAQLRWQDLSLPDRSWTIAGESAPIPRDLLPYLTEWAQKRPDDAWLLRGPRSGKPVPIHDLSRRGREFFVRHRLSGYSLALLRGKAEPALLRHRMLELVQADLHVTTGKAAAALGLSPGKARALLSALAREGAVTCGAPGVYQLPGQETPRQRMEAFLSARRGTSVSRKDLAEVLRTGDGSVTYYIKEAMENGLLTRAGRGRYQVL